MVDYQEMRQTFGNGHLKNKKYSAPGDLGKLKPTHRRSRDQRSSQNRGVSDGVSEPTVQIHDIKDENSPQELMMDMLMNELTGLHEKQT